MWLIALKKTLDFSLQFVTHVGIAHTRWATHGEPNWVNTHPQRSDDSCGMYHCLTTMSMITVIILCTVLYVLCYVLCTVLANNLVLNDNKTDKNSKRSATPPATIPGICRLSSLKILGVTVTGTLCMAEQIHGIISSCSQTLHALGILRSHGMPDVALFEVFRGVVIAKLSYAARWGFVSADDKQRLNALIRRSIRQGYCSHDINLADIIDTAQIIYANKS